MAQEFSPAFGPVKLLANANFTFQGTNNDGKISGNSNLNILSQDSSLQLSNNSNTHFDLQSSLIKAFETSNAKVSGSSNTLVFEGDNNVKFSGENNVCELKSNSNIQFDCNYTEAKMAENSNISIYGNHNKITALKNSNLKVTGDDNDISITNTDNHQLSRAPEKSRTNTMEIWGTRGISNFSFFNTWNARKAAFHATIGYIGEAIINSRDYKLGIFKFKVQKDDNPEIKMDFRNSDFDEGSLQIEPQPPNAVLITAEKKQERQSLKIVGPRVKALIGEGSKQVIVDLKTSFGL